MRFIVFCITAYLLTISQVRVGRYWPSQSVVCEPKTVSKEDIEIDLLPAIPDFFAKTIQIAVCKVGMQNTRLARLSPGAN